MRAGNQREKLFRCSFAAGQTVSSLRVGAANGKLNGIRFSHVGGDGGGTDDDDD